MVFKSNSRWQNRRERPNQSTNDRDMTENVYYIIYINGNKVQSYFASLSNSRWQNREDRPNRSTNNGDMVDNE